MNQIANTTQVVKFDNDLLTRYVEFLDVMPSSVRAYISGVKRFLRYLSENGIAQPTRDTVIAYKKALSKSYSANTGALSLSALRRFFSWLESEGLYSDITRGVKSPRIDKGHKKDAFSAVQLRKILADMDRATLKGKRDYAIFALVSATGLRTCEVIRADICDIRNVNGETVLYVQGKGRTSKTDFVKLSDKVMTAIREYLSERGKVSENEPLFASTANRNNGGRLTTRSVSGICKSAMIRSGFDSPRLTAHSLRHSAVTLALLAGVSLQEVSQFARHSNISVTLIYAHDVERLKSRCESAISNAIFG